MKRIIRLIRVWCAAALFAALFGLSFLPFLSFRTSLSGEVMNVRVSPVQAIAALGYTRQSIDDVADEFSKYVEARYKNATKTPSEEDVARLLNEFNALKFIYNSDVRELAPVTTGRLITTITIAAFAYLLGTLALFALALTRALLFTTEKRSDGQSAGKSKKSRVPWLYAVATLLPLAAAAAVGAAVATGSLLILIFAAVGLLANLLLDVFTEGRKIKVGTFVRQSVSFGLAFVLLFMLHSSYYGVKYEYQGTSSLTGRQSTRYATGKYNLFDYSEALDFANQDGDAYDLIRQTKLADVLESLGTLIDGGILDKYSAVAAIAPPALDFYAEVDDAGGGVTLVAAGLALAFGYAAAAALSAVLLLSAVGWSRGGDGVCEPLSWAAHIVHSAAAVLVLTLSIVIAATANPIYRFVAADARAFVTAVPILCLIFSLGNLIQKAVLCRKDKFPSARADRPSAAP